MNLLKNLLLCASLCVAACAMATPPADGWEKAGTATYCEGLLAMFNADLRDASWPVEMESNTAEGAQWYRLKPYGEGTWFAENFKYSDDAYIYINATNPDKVWTEDFVLLGQFVFWQLCPEGGVKSRDRYGKLSHGVISFPEKSHYWEETENPTGQKIGNPNGEFRIILPGHDTEIWKDLGESTFTDGICGPLYQGKAVTTTVRVQERYDQPGYYRLVGAWAPHGSAAHLEIDARNPDFVLIPLQDVGRETDERGATNVVSESTIYVFEGSDWDQARFEREKPESVIRMTNGVINIPANACKFHFPNYSLLGFSEGPNPAPSSVAIPGLSGIEKPVVAEGSEEYYNLMGERVAHPTRGIYIVRKGNRTYKRVF